MALDGKEAESIQDCLSFFDQRGDGKINVNQVGGTRVSVKILIFFDWNLPPLSWPLSNGISGERISIEQFIPIYHELKKEPSAQDRTTEQIISFLGNFDREDSGAIECAILEHLLTGSGEPLNQEEVQQVLAGKETSEGMIPINDLARFVTSSPN